MTTHETKTHAQRLAAWLAGMQRPAAIAEPAMPTMRNVRRHVLGMAFATVVALTIGGPLYAATSSEAVPGSPVAERAEELSEPPAETAELSLPDDAEMIMVSKTLAQDDAQTRAAPLLPCGLAYFDPPRVGVPRLSRSLSATAITSRSIAPSISNQIPTRSALDSVRIRSLPD